MLHYRVANISGYFPVMQCDHDCKWILPLLSLPLSSIELLNLAVLGRLALCSLWLKATQILVDFKLGQTLKMKDSGFQPDNICPFNLVWCQLLRHAFCYDFVLKNCVGFVRQWTLGKWHLSEIQKLAMFFGDGCALCKRKRKGSLENVSCICWMTLVPSTVRTKMLRL